MAAPVRIALDMMGGDHDLTVALSAATAMLAGDDTVRLCLVGDSEAIRVAMGAGSAPPAEERRWWLEHAPDVVSMTDRPSRALRRKTDSSMYRALQLLATDEVDAVVSAGNTGALMAMGCALLGTLPGIDRPAVCTAIPTRARPCHLLDLGANVDCRASHLHQFAIMGSALSGGLGIERPRVGLLNIGAETGKGNEQVRLAAELIGSDPQLHYIGFVEGNSLFEGVADVVVCDGFAGNVALKACEGTAALIAAKLRMALTSSWRSRLIAALAGAWLRPLYRELDPQSYNGAALLGLQGMVIKCHGDSNAAGLQQALDRAATAVRNNVLGMMQQRLGSVPR